MSNRALNMVWSAIDRGEFDELGMGAAFVLIGLADESTSDEGEDFECYPGMNTIARRAVMARSTAERHVRALVDSGWISRVPRVRSTGAISSNKYVIHRSSEMRAALKAARKAIREAGQVPADDLTDLSHPSLKSGDATPSNREIPPSPKSGEGIPQIGGCHPLKSGDQCETLPETLVETARANGEAGDAANSARLAGLARTACAGHNRRLPGEAGEDGQALWSKARVLLRTKLASGAYGAWIEPAYLGACGQALYLVALNGVAVAKLKGDLRKLVREVWQAVDPLKRELQIISRVEFEKLRPVARSAKAGG